MFVNRGLNEYRRLARVQARCEKRHYHVVCTATQVLGRVCYGYGVVVHHAEERFPFMLERHPVSNRAEVVSNVELTRRLNTAEYP